MSMLPYEKLYTYSVQPYGVGEGNPNGVVPEGRYDSEYHIRADRAQRAGKEPCAICGRTLGKTRKAGIVDVRDTTWSPTKLRADGSDEDLRVEFVGPECHKKYVSGEVK